MSAEKKKQMGVLALIVLLIVVLVGSLLFVGAVSGWFEDSKVVLSEEYYTESSELKDLSVEEYQNLINDEKSFLIFVDQKECKTADRLRGYMEDYMKDKGVMVYRMMFSEAKDSSLHDYVKYYPSVVIINKGRIRTFLRADSNEDTNKYNEYEAFMAWMDSNIDLKAKDIE